MKMAGKGQIMIRGSSGSHATYRMWMSQRTTQGLIQEKSRENPYGWRLMTSLPVKRSHYGGYCAVSGCACAHLTQENPFRGHVTFGHYGVTFHNVTSGQKAPLGWKLRTFGHFRQPWYLHYCTTFCATTIVRKKRGKKPCMRRTYFRSRYFRSHD